MPIYTIIIETKTGHYEIERDNFFDAQFIAALAEKGLFHDDVEETYVTVDCPIHGYSLTIDGSCDACYDEQMSAHWEELAALAA